MQVFDRFSLLISVLVIILYENEVTSQVTSCTQDNQCLGNGFGSICLNYKCTVSAQDSTGNTCTQDNQCSSSERCSQYKCVYHPPEVRGCTKDIHCWYGGFERCSRYRCIGRLDVTGRRCTKNSHCLNSERCFYYNFKENAKLDKDILSRLHCYTICI